MAPAHLAPDDRDCSEESLIESASADRAPRSKKRVFWPKLGRAIKTAAISTGRGTAWLAKTGYKNRHHVPAVLNGAVGDRLADGPLGIRLRFRRNGLDATPASLLTELREGNGHAVVFVHGLMADESCWQTPFGDDEGMGPRLARELGATPLYIRYNSGCRVSENGRALSRLLEELVQHHGPHIERLTLIGHSMGGLVVRSACHYATEQESSWTSKLVSVVLLGTPHHGSYVEQLAHTTADVLRRLTPQTRLLARVMDLRSGGIKDLRHGALVDEDWQDWQRPNVNTRSRRRRTEVPLLEGVAYHFVAGTLAADPSSAWATWFGDGLVARPSATAAQVTAHVFPKTSHMGLMSREHIHEQVTAALRGALLPR